MKPEPFENYAPFNRLSDEEMREAMVMHIKMGFVLKNPGKSTEAEKVAQDIVSRLTLEDLKEIHPHTFFTNKTGSEKPRNPYDLAMELLEKKS